MALFSIDMRCDCCDYVWDTLVQREEANTATEPCPACPGTGRRTVSAVTPLRASHQMGYNRGAAYEDIKSAARLKADRANMDHNKRADINKEIRALEKSAGKSHIKTSKGGK